MFTVMVLRGSAEPEIAGILVLIRAVLDGAVTLGSNGGVVSIMKETGRDVGPVFPARSVGNTLIKCAPSVKGAAGAKLQIPSGFVIAVPTSNSSMVTEMVLWGSAVPATVGSL